MLSRKQASFDESSGLSGVALNSDSIIFKVSGNLEFLEMAISTTSVFDLKPAEKLQLVQDLWDDLAAIPEDVPALEAHLQEVDRRRELLLQNPASGLTWPEVQRRIRERHRS